MSRTITPLMTDEALRDALRRLPVVDAPADAWQRVLERQKQDATGARPRGALVAFAVAACLVLVAVLSLVPPPDNSRPDTGQVARSVAAESAQRAAGMEQLLAQSRQLEQLLRQSPRGPRVVDADTAGALAELQMRIAAVDYRLSGLGTASAAIGQGSGPDTASDPRGLWAERVDLLGRLVRIRYAEAQVGAL